MAPEVTELEKLALALSDEDRAHLAATILDSLPGVLHDEDEGFAEAIRRDGELEARSAEAISFEAFDAAVRRPR